MIAIVGVASGAPSGSSTGHSLSLSGLGHVSGDLGLCVITQNGTLSITAPGGWTPIDSPQQAFTTLTCFCYYRVLDGTETSIGYAFGTARRSARAMICLRGHDGIDASDGDNSGSGADTTLTYPALTTTRDGDLLVGLGGIRYATTTTGHSPPSGWAERVDVDDGSGSAPIFGASIVTRQLAGAGSQGSAAAAVGSAIEATFTVAVSPLPFRGWGQPQ